MWLATSPHGLSGTVTSADNALFHLWQLGDVAGYPSSLIERIPFMLTPVISTDTPPTTTTSTMSGGMAKGQGD